jgi:hypothetical protein
MAILSWVSFGLSALVSGICLLFYFDAKGQERALHATLAALQRRLAEQEEQIGGLSRALALLGPADARPSLPPPLVPVDGAVDRRETVEMAPVTRRATRAGEDGRRTSTARPPSVQVIEVPGAPDDAGR